LENTESDRNVMQMFMREKITEQSGQPAHIQDLGRPNILKLANRFESYVDIENRVMQLPNARRSAASMSSPHVTSPELDSEYGNETNETNATDDTVSGVSGIMV
jgi:hypothetical protein